MKAGGFSSKNTPFFFRDWKEKKGRSLTKIINKSAQIEPMIKTGIALKYKARPNSPVKVNDLKIWVTKTFLPKKAGTSKVMKVTINVTVAAVKT